jgi:uncharacterized cupredoxin-like copper-binding protein
MTNILPARRVLAAAAALTATALFAPAHGAGAASHAAKSPFLSFNAAKHTATLKLTAGLTAVNHTLNFNGYTNGDMAVSIPKGYTVKVIFTNKSTFPHSAVVTRFSDRASAGTHPVSFPGASSPDPVAGTPANGIATFSFKATKAGTYAIICEVGHHADAGMWDVLKVTNGKQPSVKLSAATGAPVPSPTATAYAR